MIQPEWMPKNPYKCLCGYDQIEKADWNDSIAREDRNYHFFESVKNLTARKVVEYILAIAKPVERGGVVYYWITEKEMEQFRKGGKDRWIA